MIIQSLLYLIASLIVFLILTEVLTIDISYGDITVIDVENLVKEEAQIKLEKAGFVCKIEEEYSDSIQIGYVIKQSPSPKEKAQKGSTVTIFVSADIENPDDNTVSVPKLTGYNESQATALLEHSGLTVGQISTEENPADAGTIITQTPSAETKVEKGTSVNFVVSSGMPTPEPTP